MESLLFPLPTLCLNDVDNVVIARREVAPGEKWNQEHISRTGAGVGHKLARHAIASGEDIVKDGRVIGRSTESIEPGDWVHVHNMTFTRDPVDIRDAKQMPDLLPADRRASFSGFVREDGRVGTRNFIGVLIVGNCGATAARLAADWFDDDRLVDYPNVDGVIPFIHEIGCGMEMTGEPMDLLRRTLAGYIRNPNLYGAVVVALGCERNNLGGFLEQERLAVGERLRTVTIQEVGGIKNAVDAAKEHVVDMLPDANRCRRSQVSAEHLVVGLQTSSADGLSAVTTNPVLGQLSDTIVRNGGTVILSETPELIGAEADLLARATPEAATGLQARIDWWREYTRGRDTALSGRLARGSARGGVSNPVERALIGSTKSGTTMLKATFSYAEPLQGSRGLVFMDSPDYDPVSVTGQIASGATLIAMGTGGSSMFGSLPAPTLKLASNSDVFRHYESDIDLDCGPILDGDKTVAEIAESAFQALLAAASGQVTKSEYEGMGENEFVPWSIGVLA